MSTLIRHLGNTEYFYHLTNKIAPTNFSVILGLNKTIAREDLKQSIDRIVEAHEMFCTKITSTNKKNLSFVKNEETNVKIIYKSGLPEILISLIEQETNTPFENENDPFRVLCFLNIELNSQHIVFTFNHTLTDATAAISIAQKIIFNAFKKDIDARITKQEIFPNVEQMFPKEAKGFLFVRLLFRYVIRKIKFINRHGKLIPLEKGIYNFKSRNIKNYRLAFEKHEYKKVVEKCKLNKVTVHHLLSATQILALRKEYTKSGNIPIHISMPVNLRNKLITKINSNVPGLFISIPGLTIAVDREEDIWKIAKKVKNTLLEKIAHGEIFVTFNVIQKSKYPINNQGLKDLEILFSKNQPSTTITNVGLIRPLEDGSNPIYSIEFSIAPSKQSLLCSSVTSYNNTMTINYSFNTDLLPEKDADIFFERMKTIIRQIWLN